MSGCKLATQLGRDAQMLKWIGPTALGIICVLTLVAPAWTNDQETTGDYSVALKSWVPGGGKPGLWHATMSSPAGPTTGNMCIDFANGVPVLAGYARAAGNSCVFAHFIGVDGYISIDTTCRIADPKGAIVVHEVLLPNPKAISISARSDLGGQSFEWTEALSYLGDCPVPMHPEHKVLALTLRPDGTFKEKEPTFNLR